MTDLHELNCRIIAALDTNDTEALARLLAERDDRYPQEEA